jgi:pyruvate kinase
VPISAEGNQVRRAKIVATLGPATSTKETVRELIDAGLDVARFNLSHGDYSVHDNNFANVRAAAEEAGKPVAILADLQGPKIRLATFADGPHDLAVGDIFKITTEDVVGTKELVGTTFKGLANDVAPGDYLLIDDGKVRVQVVETDGVAVNVPALSEKDENDLRWALRKGADIIALSFVRDAKDVQRAHVIMAEEGRRVPIIAKIEKPQAVDALEEIVEAFDGIMVARGDLGVELPLEAVPIVQKKAVAIARRLAKPVIVATQMLESMISNPVPTRAETSDVANAVLDGADAVMLSGETSVGKYPAITVQTMARIVESTEDHGLERIEALTSTPRTQGGALTVAAVEVADFVDAKYLCIFTQTGDSARRMSRLRPSRPMIAFTLAEETRRRMQLTWGIRSAIVDHVEHTDHMFVQVDDYLLSNDLAQVGDKVIVISGSPPGIAGSTNDLRVHRVGDAVNGAAPAYQQ